jgi:hypothetical protein
VICSAGPVGGCLIWWDAYQWSVVSSLEDL